MAVTVTLSGATISQEGEFRFRLWRHVVPDHPPVTFVMLNPSTADADENGPTIRRCLGFARRWRQHGILVVNLFTLRATDPSDLIGAAGQPVEHRRIPDWESPTD